MSNTIDIDGLIVGEAMVREMRDLIARQDNTIVELSYHQARANDVNRRCLVERDAANAKLARYERVVEAARQWRRAVIADANLCKTTGWTQDSRHAIGVARIRLNDVIDALDAKETP